MLKLTEISILAVRRKQNKTIILCVSYKSSNHVDSQYYCLGFVMNEANKFNAGLISLHVSYLLPFIGETKQDYSFISKKGTSQLVRD